MFLTAFVSKKMYKIKIKIKNTALTNLEKKTTTYVIAVSYYTVTHCVKSFDFSSFICCFFRKVRKLFNTFPIYVLNGDDLHIGKLSGKYLNKTKTKLQIRFHLLRNKK